MIIYDAGKGECGEGANGNEVSRKTSFQVKSVSQLNDSTEEAATREIGRQFR